MPTLHPRPAPVARTLRFLVLLPLLLTTIGARARLLADPNANVLPILDDAIRYDPNFGDAYLERANVKVRDNDIQGPIADLGEANKILPDSPLIFYYLAQARLKEGDYPAALEAVQRSIEQDKASLPSYLLLGQIHAALDNNDQAVEYLNFYLQYKPGDITTYLELGKLQFDNGKYEEAILSMNEVGEMDSTRREPYLYRFLANVELGNGPAADQDLDRALGFYPDLFETNLALVRAHLLNDRNGSALVDLEKTLELAETDEQKELAYYWAAIVYETREEFPEAADYWELLLVLPEDSMTAEMREEAQDKLLELREPVPTSSQPRYRDFRAGDVRHSQADISKAQRLLGYAPTHTVPRGPRERDGLVYPQSRASGLSSRRTKTGRFLRWMTRDCLEPFHW